MFDFKNKKLSAILTVITVCTVIISGICLYKPDIFIRAAQAAGIMEKIESSVVDTNSAKDNDVTPDPTLKAEVKADSEVKATDNPVDKTTENPAQNPTARPSEKPAETQTRNTAAPAAAVKPSSNTVPVPVQTPAAVLSSSSKLPESISAVSDYKNLKAAMINGIKNRLAKISVPYSTTADIAAAVAKGVIDDCRLSNPYEYYSISSYSAGYSIVDGKVLSLEFNIQYNTTKAQEDELNNKVTSILSSIIKAGMTQGQKETAIHDYIVDNTKYDTSEIRNSAYDVIINHSAVCEGYALAAYKMLNQAGIQTLAVSGTANSNSHMWNLVNINGSWYQLDVTWDDPLTSNNTDVKTYNYFNLTDARLAADHSWNRSDYPVSAVSAYVMN
jgi:transglutaminase/protease-like cytokinesis protein 3